MEIFRPGTVVKLLPGGRHSYLYAIIADEPQATTVDDYRYLAFASKSNPLSEKIMPQLLQGRIYGKEIETQLGITNVDDAWTTYYNQK